MKLLCQFMYRTLTFAPKFYSKIENLLTPALHYSTVVFFTSERCSINCYMPWGYNGQSRSVLSQPTLKNASVTQLFVPWGTDIIVGCMTGVVDEQ